MKNIFFHCAQRLLALGILAGLLACGVPGQAPGALAENAAPEDPDLLGAWTVEGAQKPGIFVFYEDGRMECFGEEEGELSFMFEGNTMRTENKYGSMATSFVLSGCWAVFEKKDRSGVDYGAHLWFTPEGQLKMEDYTGATVVYSRIEDASTKDVSP